MILENIIIQPWLDMVEMPALFIQTLWEGFVSGVLYSLIALGFVLIFKASGIFNFAQGILVVFSALTLVGLHAYGIHPYVALILTLIIMALIAYSIERVVLSKLVNQPDIILFMATIGITYFLIGLGEFIFGGENKIMITNELGLPQDSWVFDLFDDILIIQQLDLTTVAVAISLVLILTCFHNFTKMGRAVRAVADDHQAALSVGIHLSSIWFVVWFISGIIALATWVVWGARAGVSFALEVIAYKALPVLMLGGLTSVKGAIIGGVLIGVLEKIFEIYWGQPLLGGNTETWFAFMLALIILIFKPQGLFGEKIIERV